MEPRQNRFQYRIFLFCLDLDEVESVTKKIRFISRNRFNLFTFRDRDHVQLPKEKPDTSKTIKEHVLTYVRENGIDPDSITTIKLVTNLCTLGYQFNPVSFYFCLDKNELPVCSIVEVCNTFGEMKLYFLSRESFANNGFRSQMVKNFYVSPFIDMDTHFDFQLQLPGKKLNICINDLQQGKKFFISTLIGEQKPLTNTNVLRYALRFPFITFRIIFLIHWQAFRLWVKRISYHKKTSFITLQQDVLKPHKSITE
jgi:DUF1365 family protein